MLLRSLKYWLLHEDIILKMFFEKGIYTFYHIKDN